MKNFSLFMLLVIFSIPTFSCGNNHTKKFTMKHGKYRQAFYLPQADSIPGGYKLDTVINDAGICVTVIGNRDGDFFKISAQTTIGRNIVMQQYFFMDGSHVEENAINPWILTWKKKALDNFFWQYFGIKIKTRKEFIKEQRRYDFLKASGWELSFFWDIKILDKEEKIW